MKQNNRCIKFKLNYAGNITIKKIIEELYNFHGSVDLLDVPVGLTY